MLGWIDYHWVLFLRGPNGWDLIGSLLYKLYCLLMTQWLCVFHWFYATNDSTSWLLGDYTKTIIQSVCIFSTYGRSTNGKISFPCGTHLWYRCIYCRPVHMNVQFFVQRIVGGMGVMEIPYGLMYKMWSLWNSLSSNATHATIVLLFIFWIFVNMQLCKK